MARTAEGRRLTEAHYREQLRVRARALRDYQRLWPLWEGDARSFNRLVAASIVLVRAHRQQSNAVSAAYFEAFRRAERVGGSATPILDDGLTDVNERRLIAGLWETGRNTVARSLAAGKPPQAAMATAFTTTSGTVGRFVLEGGRGTLLRSIGADSQARGWARVTAAEPCAFCAMLASRGPVYLTEDTADFQAHDHCTCTAEPGYEGSAWPGRAREFKAIYDEAVRDALNADDLRRGTSNDLLNAFRRRYERG